MWSSKHWLAIPAFGLFVALMLWLACASSRRIPTISIGVLSYDISYKGPFVPALVGLTNTSGATIRCDNLTLNGDAWVRVETVSGWAVRTLDPTAVVSLLPGWLRPGSNTSARLLLPPETLRWQVGCKVRTASMRDSLLSKLPAKWRNRLHPLCERLLSGKEGPKQEMTSGVFECPTRFFAAPTLFPSSNDSRGSTAVGPNAF